MSKVKIFLYSYELPMFGGDHMAVALAEDGEVMYTEFASTAEYAKQILGLSGDKSRYSRYLVKYPDGFKLVWVDNLSDPDFLNAVALNRKHPEYRIAPLPEIEG